MDLEDHNARFKKYILEEFKDLFKYETRRLLKEFDKTKYDSLEHIYIRLTGTQPFKAEQMCKAFTDTLEIFRRDIAKFKKRKENLETARTMNPVDSIDLTNEFIADEIIYRKPRKFSSVRHHRKFDYKKYAIVQEQNRLRNRSMSQSGVLINRHQTHHPNIDNRHKRHFDTKQNQRTPQPDTRNDPRLHIRSVNPGISSCSSNQSLKPTEHQHKFGVPSKHPIPSPPLFNMRAKQLIPPVTNPNDQRNQILQFSNFSRQLPPAQTYREHKQRKLEEREAKKPRISRWNKEEQNVPMNLNISKEIGNPRKESIDRPRLIMENTSIASSLSPKSAKISTKDLPSTPSAISPNKSPNTLICVQIAKNTQDNSTSQISQSSNSLQQSSSTANHEQKTKKTNEPTHEISKNQTSTEPQEVYNLSVPIKLEIKQEVESDDETIPDDGASVCSQRSSQENSALEFRLNNTNVNDNHREASCDEFIPINIKNEPMEMLQNTVNSVVEASTGVKVEIKTEYDGDGSTEPEEEANELNKDSSDAGSEDSEDSDDKSDILGACDTFAEPKFMAEFGLCKPKKSLSESSPRMQRVRDWLQKRNVIDSPPESPCYDFPMSENEEENIWQTPPYGTEEEIDDDNITIIKYEPQF